ncbi:MAG: hypothetical protein RLZZ524_2105 [Pseudomonadota bacterium]|jgi:hypothetical protein
MHDLHNNIRALRVVSPVAIGTTGTGQTGKVIDRQGYGGVEFIVAYGTVTATNAVFTVVCKEGDVTGTLTSVADADLLGTEALAGLGATTPRTSGVSKNVVKRLGYRGKKRYVNLSISSTITAATPVSIDAVLHSPSIAPTSNP